MLIYQIYPSTWGSFQKMAEHLPRLEKLGVDYVWISPCFESPWADGGYDVADYMKISPKFGTMEDFDHFVAEAKKRKIQVLLDLVMNHTSTAHKWFQESMAGNPKYKDYYIWSNNDLGWRNNFDGGPAFQWNEKRNQYYLHLFCTEQADLNWQNPAVLEEFGKIIDFWTKEHGVAGFRLDVAQYLAKDLTPSIIPKCFGTAKGFLKYWQKPETVEILHKLFDGRGLFVFSEAGYATKRQFRAMAGKNGPLSGSLNVMTYGLGPAASNFKLFRKLLRSWQKESGFISCAESHDVPRSPSRYERSGETIMAELFRSEKAQMVCLYQGQELGLQNPELSLDIQDYADVQTIMRYERMTNRGMFPQKAMKKLRPTSRDNARQPLNMEAYAKQEASPHSCLNATKNMILNWKHL